MSGLLSIHGHAYTSDSDYAPFRGRKVSEFTVTQRDERRNCTITTTYEVIDFARPKPIPPSDPDVQLAEELFPYEDARVAASMAGIKQAKQERDKELLEAIQKHLAEHGPMSATRVARELSVGDFTRAIDIMRQNEALFVFHGGQFSVWGLPGQPYNPEPIKLVSKLMIAIRDAIQEFGPQTSLELARRLGSHPRSVHISMDKHPEWFRVVEIRPRQGRAAAARVWGLTNE